MRFNYWQTFYENGFYHIYNRAIGREWLFLNDSNYRFFLNKWKQYINSYIETYAYCLMSNHFHFVVRVRPINEVLLQKISTENTVASNRFCANERSYDAFLEDQFKRLFSAYTLAFNKQNNRHGSLFQASFKRVQLSNEVKLLNTICYVHHNPIHHNISYFYDSWTYSSFKSYLSDFPTLVSREEGLALFDGTKKDKKAFENYHELYRLQKLSWKESLDWEDDLQAD